MRLELLREILALQEVGRQAQNMLKQMESTANLSAYETFISTVPLVDSVVADGDPFVDQAFFTIYQGDAIGREAVAFYESDSWGERFMLYQRMQTRAGLVVLGGLGLGKVASGSARMAGARVLAVDVGKIAANRLAASGRTLSSLVSRARASFTKIEQRVGCFVAGTLVETIDGSVPIEQLKPGDLVLSRSDQTGEQAYKPIGEVFVRERVPVLRLEIQAGADTSTSIDTTAEHPFWVHEKGWVEAEKLDTSDHLLSANGALIAILSVSETQETATVFNLRIDEFHSFFVGEERVWVHNNDACKLVPYGGPGGGHHVPAKSAFVDAVGV